MAFVWGQQCPQPSCGMGMVTAGIGAAAGMKAVFHPGEARVTILGFGRQDSTLLAWGDASGSVCIASLQEPAQLLHVSFFSICAFEHLDRWQSELCSSPESARQVC